MNFVEFSILGACGASDNIYETLELKYIQLDTLGWIMHRYISSLGHYESALRHFKTALSFYNNYHKDVSILAHYENLETANNDIVAS